MTDSRNTWKSVTKKAGVEDFRFHDLRHTAATRMAEAGVDIRMIAELLGHSTIQMTMRYAHATDDAKRRAAEALEAYTRYQVSAPATADAIDPKAE
jgi:integrase